MDVNIVATHKLITVHITTKLIIPQICVFPWNNSTGVLQCYSVSMTTLQTCYLWYKSKNLWLWDKSCWLWHHDCWVSSAKTMSCNTAILLQPGVLTLDHRIKPHWMSLIYFPSTTFMKVRLFDDIFFIFHWPILVTMQVTWTINYCNKQANIGINGARNVEWWSLKLALYNDSWMVLVL